MTDHPPSGLTFAVPDLHGRLDLLEAALGKIETYSGPGVGHVVFLGDYVDRGPEGAAVLARLKNGPPPGWHWTCLKGNHEAIMALALRDPDRLDWWLENGGAATIASYRGDRSTVAAHIAWIDTLPTFHTDRYRLYVHAGVDPAVPLDDQPEKTLLWKRYPDDADEGHGHLHLVHGHNPNVGGPLRLANRTDLDTLAWRTGRLCIGVFDDARAGGPFDVIEVKGERAGACRVGSPVNEDSTFQRGL